MKVLVTGANGFLGSHIVRVLLEKEYEVKAFIMKGTTENTLQGLTYEVFYGNLLNSEDISSAIQNCDYIIHTAAITDMWPSKNEFSWKLNFEVVKEIAKAVKMNQIQKFIHVGTANSFGYGSKEYPGNEKSEFNSGVYGLDYIDSKKAAQDFLLQKHSENKLPVVIINPTFMIGEYDAKPGPGEMILPVITGKVPGFAAGGRCFAYVKDVAYGCVNAITKGKIGECYITGGQNMNYKEFFGLISDIAAVKKLKMKIPTFVAVFFAALVEIFAKIGKKKPMLTRTMAKIAGDGHYYSSSKAIRELELPQTDIKIALERAIEWYKLNGYIQ